MTTRELKNIVLNLQQLFVRGAYRDLLIYQGIVDHELSRHDNAAVKQAFREWLNQRNAINWD